jgi:hypothetical protein
VQLDTPPMAINESITNVNNERTGVQNGLR